MKKPNNYRPLLTTENAKTTKGESLGYLTGILYMAPANEAGIGNLCPMSSSGCRAACLFTAGRGRMAPVRNARIDKTLFWFNNRHAFMESLIYDIAKLERDAKRQGLVPVVRPNGTQDIMWERQLHNGSTIFDLFPGIKFYDYTKIWTRFASGPYQAAKNYCLTLSRSESNHDKVLRVMRDHPGVNVAVVFNEIPAEYLGRPVINADEHDLRFLDPAGVVCGLKAKGDGKHDQSGFVVNV